MSLFKPNKIIIHHSLTADSGTVSWPVIRRYHLGLGWADIGYHAGTELVTSGNDTRHEILIGRPWDIPGAQTTGQNHSSFGFCFVGNFDVEWPTEASLDMAARFLRNVMDLMNIPPAEVYGHRDFSSKSCPGTLFPLKYFRDKVINLG